MATVEHFVDDQFAATIAAFSHTFEDVDFDQPIEVTRGRCWYNLHVVLVHFERYRIRDIERINRAHDQSIAIAKKKGYSLAAISVMPDHLHMALKGVAVHSPEDIVLTFQNNLAFQEFSFEWQAVRLGRL